MSLVTAEEESQQPAQFVDATTSTSGSKDRGTYGQILKSSAIVGGSSLINIAVGIVRTKLMALMLGPAGFGMLSVFGSMVTLSQTFAGMGVNSSGVRQIADAASSGNDDRIFQTTTALRRLSLVLGAVGALAMVLFSRPIAQLTFGNSSHAAQVRALSLAAFLAVVSASQGALINGMRRIADLARMNVAGAFFGTLLAVPIVYLFRESGVVPALIIVALMMCLASWWYSRKVHLVRKPVPATAILQESASLLKLGFAFMASGLMTVGVAYVVRILVSRRVGLEATGLYQSAWTLGSLYVGFILQAMGADFYPRLTACSKDNAACNRLVNEQAHVGLLLGGPGVLATLTFAPVIITLFYSARFGMAVNVLRWICLGTLLQVVTWPMGFIIVAKARQTLFVTCEVAWSVVSLALAWACIEHFGLVGAGIAFFGSYVFHGLLIYGVVRRESGYRWSGDNLRAGLLFFSAIGAVLLSFFSMPFRVAVALGTLVTLISSLYSLRRLSQLVSFGSVWVRVKTFTARFRPVVVPQQAADL